MRIIASFDVLMIGYQGDGLFGPLRVATRIGMEFTCFGARGRKSAIGDVAETALGAPLTNFAGRMPA